MANGLCIVTGACGLVGFSVCKRLLAENWQVRGIDDNSRQRFFGAAASTKGMWRKHLHQDRYQAHKVSTVSFSAMQTIFRKGCDLVLHCAAQPSHDWATTHIMDDFRINAIGTLNVLEACRLHCPNATVVHVSTSKCFGDNPNKLPLEKIGNRLDLPKDHPLWNGIPEDFSVDNCLHSFFGVSKLTGDLLAQEYGRHLGMKVGIFRPGCVVGGHQKGARLHGFLSYLAKCVKHGLPYEIYGYGGDQVRCNIHSDDLADAMLTFAENPKCGEVYNCIGRGFDISMNEAIAEFEKRLGKKLEVKYVDTPRTGDHKWFIGSSEKFRRDYNWTPKWTLSGILDEVAEAV